MSYYLPIKLDFTEDEFQYIKCLPQLLRHVGLSYMSLQEVNYLHNYIHTRQTYNIDEIGDRDKLLDTLLRSGVFKNKNDIIDYDYIDSELDEFYAIGIVNNKLFYIEQVYTE